LLARYRYLCNNKAALRVACPDPRSSPKAHVSGADLIGKAFMLIKTKEVHLCENMCVCVTDVGTGWCTLGCTARSPATRLETGTHADAGEKHAQ